MMMKGNAEGIIRYSNPFQSRIRAIPSFFSKHNHQPVNDGNDNTRFIDNDHVLNFKKEMFFPNELKHANPIFLNPFIVREALNKTWIENERSIDTELLPGNNPLLTMVYSRDSNSYPRDQEDKIKKQFDSIIISHKIRQIPYLLLRNHEVCDVSFNVLKESHSQLAIKNISFIPKCLHNLPNIESIDFSHMYGDSIITKIENLDNFQFMKELNFDSNNIKKIEGLDTLPRLMDINFKRNKISRIENLDQNLQLRRLQFHENNIKKIEGFDKNINIKYIDLTQNKISRIENIEHLDNLKRLILSNNSLRQFECDEKAKVMMKNRALKLHESEKPERDYIEIDC